jgi:hypothetical protein
MRERFILKFSFLLVLFTQISLVLYGQSSDRQWYVVDGIGWNGSAYSENITKFLTIKGIGLPNTDCNPDAKDDIFIIFEDGSYYTSRHSNIPFSYYGEGDAASLSLHAPEGKNIKYLYSTNVYDNDPPPLNIIVNPGNTNPINNISPLNSGPIITLNHNPVIAPNKDFTVIIDLSKENNFDNSLYLDFQIIDPLGNILTLDHNNRERNIDYAEVLQNSSVFKNGSDYFNVLMANSEGFHYGNSEIISSSNIGRIVLNNQINQIRNVYINLKLKSLIPLDSNYQISFTLGDNINNKDIAQVKDTIRHAHDPNVLEVQELCTECKKRYAKYRCFFYNRTTTPANGLAVSIPFPDHIDTHNIRIVSAKVDGRILNTDSITIKLEEEKVIFIFPAGESTKQCEGSNEDDEPLGVELIFLARTTTESSTYQNFAPSGDAYTYFFYGNDGEQAEYLPYPLTYQEKKDTLINYISRSIEIKDDCAEINDICNLRDWLKKHLWKVLGGAIIIGAAYLLIK